MENKRVSNNSNNTAPQLAAGDFSRALRGEIKLTIGPLLQRSWDITLRSLPWMLGVFIGVMVLNMVVSEILMTLLPYDEQAMANPENIDWEQVNLGNLAISSVLQELILAPFTAMLVFVGMLNAIDQKPSFAKLRGVLQFAPQLMLVALFKIVIMALGVGIIIGVVSFINVALAIVLGVLAAIYLQLVMMLAVPLIIDRQLTASRALIASFMVINKAMFPVLGLMVLVGIIVLISALPLLLGLIFTLPMAFNAIGVVYNALVGCTDNSQISHEFTE
ncbi:hypothetical protein CWI76_02840 [Pseudidiomarina marina]|uniref:Uncharacterized protein n=1 Tax=Pseudidiomarina marina TaxID=502366 RepID=A0A432YJQ6_9GAMM|nr:hypothetical protein CWI76_02840 [Pseudidiomarina marina]